MVHGSSCVLLVGFEHSDTHTILTCSDELWKLQSCVQGACFGTLSKYEEIRGVGWCAALGGLVASPY